MASSVPKPDSSAVLRLQIDSSGYFAPVLGEAGAELAELDGLATRLQPLLERLQRSGTDTYPFLALPFRDDAPAIAARGRTIASRFRQCVVFGIGGSSLGGEMLTRMLAPAGGATVRFYDNVDPVTLAALSAQPWQETFLFVISKSGNTAETLAQFLSLLPELERTLGSRLREHVLVITENTDGALYRLAAELGLDIWPHPPVGGRYSVLSAVGLLPAAVAGVPVERVLAGARRMAQHCFSPLLADNPPLLGAAAQYLHERRGRKLAVYMAYADRALPFVPWAQQLIAESLGKRAAAGDGVGVTPVGARGVTDQHSQLQLYLDGPDDKQFTLLTDRRLGSQGAIVPDRFGHLAAVRPLVGHTLGELFRAEFDATRTTLARHGRAHRVIEFAADDPEAVGELILLLEMETVAFAALLGVDPFDQPAVEEGKQLAREYLAR